MVLTLPYESTSGARDPNVDSLKIAAYLTTTRGAQIGHKDEIGHM